MKALNVFLALVVSVAMAVLTAELGLRLVPALRAQPSINRFDPATGWSMTPMTAIVREVAGRKLEFAINAQGLRDDEPPAKPAGTLRVVVLGDSFALGYTVARGESFADLLQQRWNAEGRAVEVINAGTEGWSTDQEVAWLMARGKDYAPDVVLVCPYENDIYWCGEQRYNGKDKPRFAADGTLEPRALVELRSDSLLKKSAIARFLGLSLGALLTRHPTASEFTVDGTKVCIAREFAPLLTKPPEFMGSAVTRTQGALLGLQGVCNLLGAKLVLAPIPSKSAVDAAEREFFRTWDHGLSGLADDAWSPDKPVEFFLDFARQHGVDSIDAREALRGMAAQHALYFPREVEWHFNAAGNRAFANVLHERLDLLSVFPAAHSAKHAEAPYELHVDSAAPPARWPYVFAMLWAAVTLLFMGTYADERNWKAPLKVGAMLAAIFTIVLGGGALVKLLPPAYAPWILGAFLVGIAGFVVYKLGRRVAIIAELLRTFVERGHWYLMPLLVVLLTIGSLLVVAASSPLIAPFIYTLF